MSTASLVDHPSRSAKPVEPLAYSIPQVCDALGAGETYVRDLLRSGRLKCVKHGRRVFVPKAAVIAFLALADQEGER